MDNVSVSQSVENSLPEIQQLLKEAWRVFADHWKNLVRFSVLNVILGFGVSMMVGLGFFMIFAGILFGEVASWRDIGIFLVALAVGFFIALTLFFWVSAALFEAVRVVRREGRDLGLREAFQLGRKRMWGLAFISILTGFVVFGGLILLIIPGIVFVVWFIFGPFVFINENISGTDALRQSKKYVSGRWWVIAGRIVGLWLVLFAASLLLQLLSQMIILVLGSLGSIISFMGSLVFNIFTTIFTLIYLQLLYEAVKNKRFADASASGSVATSSLTTSQG